MRQRTVMTMTSAHTVVDAGCGQRLVVEPLTPSIGAVVSGVELSVPLDVDTRRRLALAVAEHHVVFLRRQFLTPELFHAFAAQFGELTVHPVDRAAGTPKQVTTITDSAEHPPAGFAWHTDLSWVAEPPTWGLLNAVEIPATGGDTMWASATELYRRLDPQLRRRLEGACVVHRPTAELLATVRRHRGDAVAEQLAAAHPPTAKPLVRRHAVTGQPLLCLSPLYTDRLDTTGTIDVAALAAGLDDPAVHVRWRWQPGDLAIWDETATAHKALADHYPQRRQMRRCTLTVRPAR